MVYTEYQGIAIFFGIAMIFFLWLFLYTYVKAKRFKTFIKKKNLELEYLEFALIDKEMDL